MSPKNKGKFGKGKSPVEVEDEFVSTTWSLAEKLKPHAVTITVGVAAVFVVAAAVIGYRWWDARKEAKATEIYRKAVEISRVFIMPEPPPAEGQADADKAAEGQADTGKTVAVVKDEDKDGIPDSFPSVVERAKATLVPLEALRAEYGSTDVARGATLLYAATLYDAGNYTGARDMYTAYLGSAPPSLAPIAREGMAYAEEAMAMSIEDPQARTAALGKVLEAFRAIQPSEQGPERDRALYHEARILAAMGKTDEAIAALKKAREIAPESKLSYDIGERLAQLESAK